MGRVKSKKKGSILVTTLWITAIISLLALGVGFRASLDMRLSKYNFDKLRAASLARAGILKAKEQAINNGKDYDSVYESGFRLRNSDSPETLFGRQANKLEEGDFSVHYVLKGSNGEESRKIFGPLDEERKFNLNISKFPGSAKSEYARILKGLSPLVTQEIINAIIDWQDEDSLVTAAGGAEEPYYAYLEAPYKCKNADFSVIEELLLVKGVTKGLYDGIKERITVNSNGKININTASEEVVAALINDEQKSYEVFIARILEYLKGPDSLRATADDGVFLNLDNLKALAETEKEKARINALSPFLVFKSNNYRIISHGNIDGAQKVIECVFSRVSGPKESRIKYYYEY